MSPWLWRALHPRQWMQGRRYVRTYGVKSFTDTERAAIRAADLPIKRISPPRHGG